MENKFIVDQKTLVSILSSMQPICAKRTTIDTTTFILFNIGPRELTLKSTDLEISLQYSCEVKESSFDQGYSFLVSGRRLFELVKELDGDIEFQILDNQLVLQTKAIRLTLHIKDAQEFPPFPERIENLMQLDTEFFLSILGRVSFLIPQSNPNPALNGLLLEISPERLQCTSTDGHCLVQVTTSKYTLANKRSWLVPRRAIFEIKKLLEMINDRHIFLGICGNQLVFSGLSFNFFTKLLADSFPSYDSIIKKDDFFQAAISRLDLIKTLRRSSCLLSGQFIATRFDFDAHEVKASLHNKEVGKLEEALVLHKFNGEKLDIRFYSPYLLNGLQVFSDDQVSFYLKNSSKPIIFESEAEQLSMTYLVMPVSPTMGN